MSVQRLNTAQWCDRAALVVLAMGVVLMVQPWWKLGFQSGFFVTLFGVIAQLITGHVAARSGGKVAEQIAVEKASTP